MQQVGKKLDRKENDMAFTRNIFSDEPSQQLGTRTGGGFPPARHNGSVSASRAELSGNDTKNPISTGRGGIKASLRMKNAGTKDTPGTEKTVNLF